VFDEAMRSLFADFKDPTRVALLKALQRAAAKADPVTGDYLDLPKPYVQHIKDYLRCEQRCDDHREMNRAMLLLEKHHNVVLTK
jgi:hypothetical protein